MSKELRFGVTGMVVVAATLLGQDWPQRFGLFCLFMAFIVTIDMTGDGRGY